MVLSERRGIAIPLAVMLAFAAACEDVVTEPDGFVLAEEAAAVLRSAADLPALPDIIGEAGASGAETNLILVRADELWTEAAAENDLARASRRRASAIALATPHLAGLVTEPALDSIQDELRGWIGLAGGMLRHLSLPQVEAALNDAARLLARADVAEARDDHGTAVWLTLSASSRLVDTTPRVVARRMTLVVSEELERRRGADDLDAETFLRSERMVHGARQALDEEDYVRAIQRAYYAGQLLNLRPADGGHR